MISPVVRKLARDRGIDLAEVRPSDPSGVIRRCDIEAFSPATAGRGVAAGRRTAGLAAAPASSGCRWSGLRKVMADKLSQSRREIPEATVWVDVDATGLLEARRALNAARPDEPVSVLALVARFCVLGLRRYRELNSRIAADAVEILPDVNLGFAAQTPRGLVVPVVPQAQALTTRQLSAALTERTEAARAGSLTPAQLTGGTFTVNNYGVFGVDGSAAIINHPEVAILGLGRIIDRPWVHDGHAGGPQGQPADAGLRPPRLRRRGGRRVPALRGRLHREPGDRARRAVSRLQRCRPRWETRPVTAPAP